MVCIVLTSVTIKLVVYHLPEIPRISCWDLHGKHFFWLDSTENSWNKWKLWGGNSVRNLTEITRVRNENFLPGRRCAILDVKLRSNRFEKLRYPIWQRFQGPPSGKNATGINEESNCISVPLVQRWWILRSSNFKITKSRKNYDDFLLRR